MLPRRWGGLVASLAMGCAVLAAPASASPPLARVAEVSAARPLDLVFPLAFDQRALARLARAVTTPGSPQYGHYESIEQLARRFGASAATRRIVTSYLRAVGARGVRIDTTGLFADATVTAALAEKLFSAPLARFHSAREGTFIAPTAAVKLPRPLRGRTTGVVGLDTRPLATPPRPPRRGRNLRAHAAGQPSSALPRTGTPFGCPGGLTAGERGGDPATAGFTPNQYLAAYGFTQLQQSGFTGQGERVALIEIDGFKASDVSTFAQCFGLTVPPLNGFGVGLSHPLPPGGESTLDLELLDAAAPGLEAIDVYESRANAADTLSALTAPLQNRRFRPQVISASLGLCEPAVLGVVGLRGVLTTEAALQMAAISGITFLASSGDQGSADCTGPDGLPIHQLAVNYPASSPWTTGVGGTNLLLNPANQITRQLVWNDTNVQPGSAGGGGPSALFGRPFFQRGTVGGHRRAVPDVAMLADIIPGFAFYCSASRDCINSATSDPWQAVGGTSAGTPLLAGGFALVDQALRAQRKQDLGLANPLLYEIGRSASMAPKVFSDVTAYGNDVGPYIPGNGQPLGCCSAGAGFDLASGWGSVDLANFAVAALALQPPQITLSLPRHQHPVKRRKILATVSCTGSCRFAAFAVVRIGRRRPFGVYSRIYRLGSSGSRTIGIAFSRKQRRRLRAALRRHRRVRATVFAVMITGRRTVEFRTEGRRLRIG